MTYDEFTDAVRDAEAVERRARDMVCQITRLCMGRLHTPGVPAYVLSALKRELQDWNLHTKQWRTH